MKPVTSDVTHFSAESAAVSLARHGLQGATRRIAFAMRASAIDCKSAVIAGLLAPGSRLGIADLVQRYEIGAGWSQVAKSSRKTYINLQIGSPEFAPTGCAAASSRSTSRPKTAPPTSLCGNRATSEHQRPPPGNLRRGFCARTNPPSQV